MSRATEKAPARSAEIHTDVIKAETYAAHQRRVGLRFIQIDRRLAENPADIAMCERVADAARNDPGEFENLISFPEVNRLFCRGAIYFKRGK